MNRMTAFFVKSSFPSVSRRGVFQYPLFSFFITTDPGLRLSRMTATTIQKHSIKKAPD